jgi:hypothetical protein
MRILQQFEIFNCSNGLFQLQIDVITREPVSVSPAVIIERRPSKRRRKGNGRGRGRKKINEDKTHNSHYNGNGDKAGEQPSNPSALHDFPQQFCYERSIRFIASVSTGTEFVGCLPALALSPVMGRALLTCGGALRVMSTKS